MAMPFRSCSNSTRISAHCGIQSYKHIEPRNSNKNVLVTDQVSWHRFKLSPMGLMKMTPTVPYLQQKLQHLVDHNLAKSLTITGDISSNKNHIQKGKWYNHQINKQKNNDKNHDLIQIINWSWLDKIWNTSLFGMHQPKVFVLTKIIHVRLS